MAREMGDTEGLYREEQRRVDWRRENALRRHNFVGFIGEILKCVVREKVRQGEGQEGYQRWMEEAVGKTRKRMEERREGRGGGMVGGEE